MFLGAYDGGLYSDDVTEPPLTPAMEDVVEFPGEEEAEAHAEHTIYAYEYAEEEAVEDAYDYADDEEAATWRCGSDGCHPVTEDRELRVAALREAFDAVGKKPFNASAGDPFPELSEFYADQLNHDAEEEIFEELYGTTTTRPGA